MPEHLRSQLGVLQERGGPHGDPAWEGLVQCMLPGCKPPCDHTCGPEPQQERGERGTLPLTAVTPHQHGDRRSVCLQTLAGEEESSCECLVGLKASSPGITRQSAQSEPRLGVWD